jgi:hypothetical protein
VTSLGDVRRQRKINKTEIRLITLTQPLQVHRAAEAKGEQLHEISNLCQLGGLREMVGWLVE